MIDGNQMQEPCICANVNDDVQKVILTQLCSSA